MGSENLSEHSSQGILVKFPRASKGSSGRRRKPESLRTFLAVLRLAWIEWCRGTLGRKPGGGSGRRDFRQLTILLLLTWALALFAACSREGLLDQLLNTSLGYLEGTGIPIWVLAEVGGIESRGLDHEAMELISQIEGADLEVYPYRPVEGFDVSLPMVQGSTAAVWDEGMAFRGRAVDLEDPLWPQVVSREKKGLGNLEITLDRKLFERSFSCNGYRTSLEERLPAPFVPAKVSDDTLECLMGGEIWLELRFDGFRGRELHAFKIHWRKRIQVMEETAFLLPLHTFHALKLAQLSPRLNYFPEDQGGAAQRLDEVWVWADSEPPPEGRLESLIHCLGEVVYREGRIRFERAYRMDWFEACAEHHGLADGNSQDPELLVAETTQGQALERMERGLLRTSCHLLGSRLRTQIICSGSDSVAVDPMQLVDGFPSALVYVKERSQLFAAVEQLRALKVQRNIRVDARDTPSSRTLLTMHPSYQDALMRFSFIVEVMTVLDTTYLVGFLVFLLALLWVQINLVVMHRRRIYGVFLAKGMGWSQVLSMLLFQLTMSFFCAWAAALVILHSLRWFVNSQVEQMLRMPMYDGKLVSRLDLLPISGADMLLGALVGWIVLCSVACISTFWISPPERLEPSRLLHT